MNLLVTGYPFNGYQTYITIRQGETVTLGMELFDVSGLPFNLTGYNIKSEIAFPTPLLLTSSNGGIVINSPIDGLMQMNIASSVTEAIASGTYPFDMFLESQNGSETPWLCGNFIINQSVTPVP